MDKRAVRAAGYLKLQSAVPLLERRLKSIFIHQSIRSSIVWALLKIKVDKVYLEKIIDVVNNGAGLDGLSQTDAVNLLSDFGKEPSALNALLHAFLSEDTNVSIFAVLALRRIFKDNVDVSNLLGGMPSFSPLYARNSIVKQIEKHISA